MQTRRSFLAGLAALPLAGTAGRARAAQAGLDGLASRTGRFFGTAVTARAVSAADALSRLLDAECGVWVPEWQLKWGALVEREGAAPDFRNVDAIVAAARQGGKRMRGHTLLWHENVPPFVAELASRSDWDRYVAPHIAGVAGRYRDAFFQWDVVNEAIEPKHGEAGGMRRTPFYAMLGPDYVAEAFRLAHAAAPGARLYLNDYGVCYAEGWQERRRESVLSLLERLLREGVPVHGFGIQGHLDTRFRFDERRFARFVGALESLGLEIAITELDVREADGAAGIAIPERQRRAADEVRKVLSVACASKALAGVVTWGLSDGDSWLRKWRDLPDNQGLPYDSHLAPTPMRAALAECLTATARR